MTTRPLPALLASALRPLLLALACACATAPLPPQPERAEPALVALAQPSGQPLVDWLVCGEFAARSAPRGPATVPHRGQWLPRADGSSAAWFRVLGPSTVDGKIDLLGYLSMARPTRDVHALAYTTFDADRAGPAHLDLVSAGAVSVWLNGAWVHTVSADSGGLHRAFAEVVPVELRAGRNELLLEVASGPRRWAFSARVCTDRQAFPEPEDDELFLCYGRKLHSRNREDVLIRHFFAGRPPGTFLDVGASHFRRDSNTYALEHLGWSGIAVDALEEFASGYAQYRPNTRFFNYLVGDTSVGHGELHRAKNSRVSSTDPAWAASAAGDSATEVVRVPFITLDDLLEREGVERLDFLAMDIELAEPAALRGFDIRRWRPELVCIEAEEAIEHELADYFREHGYERVHEYMPFDGDNWYFRPGE